MRKVDLFFLLVLFVVPSCAAQTPTTVDYTDKSTFTASTSNVVTLGFNGILPSGVRFKDFTTLNLSGVSFSTPTPNTFVNVTTSTYYAISYPVDFIVNSVNSATNAPNPNNTLVVSFNPPVNAAGIDYGGLGFFGPSTATITLSDGHVFTPSGLASEGQSQFYGFVSSDAITSLTLSVNNDAWVVTDVLLAERCQSMSQKVTSCDANFTPSTLDSGLSGPAGLVYRHPTNDLVVAQNASSVVSTVSASTPSSGPFPTFTSTPSPFDVAVRASDGLVAVLNEAAGQINFYLSGGSQQGTTLTISTITNNAYSCGAGLAFDTSGNLYVGAGPAIQANGQAAASASPGNCQTTGWSVLEFPGPSPWTDKQPTTVATALNEIGGLAFSAAPPPYGTLYAVSSSGGNVYQIPLGAPVPVLGVAALAAAQECAPVSAAACSATTIVSVAASLDPRGIAADSLTGDLFISEFNGTTVYRIPAGTTMVTGFATGFNNTSGLAFDTTGNLYVCDYNAGIIYKFNRASNATAIVPLTSGSPNTFTFVNPNPAMSDQYQTITIPASANLNGAVSLQEIFVVVSPATLNATLSKGSPGDPSRFGGTQVPPGTTCAPAASANNNCVLTVQVCYDVNGNPFAICPVQEPAGRSDLILLTSHWNGTLPANKGMVIGYDSDQTGKSFTNIGIASTSDPTITGGTKGLCSETTPVNLGAQTGPDFSFSLIPAIALVLDGSNAANPAQVTVNSINGFSNTPVNLTVSNQPVGVSATTSAASVTPPSGGSASTNLTVSLQPYVTPTPASTPIPLLVSGAYTDSVLVTHTHSTFANVTITATPQSIESVVDAFQAAGCISDSGFRDTMNNKLSAAQSAIAGGDLQTGVNTLGAFDDEDEDDGGKHISPTCTIGNHTFNPVQILHIDAKSLMDSYKIAHAANPVIGYVLNSSNVGVPGAVVSIFNSSNQKVASRVTDITGFYFFGKTSILTPGFTYTVTIMLPEESPYSLVTPSQQSFTWNNMQTQLMNFLVK